MNYNLFMKRPKSLSITILKIIAFSLIIIQPFCCYASETVNDKTLIIYYSRTAKSKLVADELKNSFCVDILEIKDLKDRSGTWGFLGAAFDNMFGRYTDIEPAHPDLSGYSLIILVCPIWNWKLCTPIKTFLKDNSLENKQLVVFTTANIDIKKYEKFDDDAPFIKRFLRDYLRKSSKSMRLLASNSGAEIIRHYHAETKNVSDEHIIKQTRKNIDDLMLHADLKKCPALPLKTDSDNFKSMIPSGRDL